MSLGPWPNLAGASLMHRLHLRPGRRGKHRRLRPGAVQRILSSMSKPLLPLLAALLAAVLPVLADAPSPGGGEAVVTHDFAALSLADALRLQGHPARYRVVLDSLPDEAGGFVLYDCVSPVGESRTVYLLPGQDVEERVTVEAVLVIKQMPPSVGPGGTFFPGFTKFRIVDARRCN
jgi:hypothetical protein